jgi:hypothetical protein
MAKTKTAGFFFKATPEEMEWIEKRMEQAGISNKSAYLRKIAIDGHVINIDLPGLNEINRLLRVTANNVNQIVHRVNSGGDAPMSPKSTRGLRKYARISGNCWLRCPSWPTRSPASGLSNR